MNIEKELIKALETMDESEFDALLGDIEFPAEAAVSTAARKTGSDPAAAKKGKESEHMINKKTGKRSAAVAILLAAAFLAAITASALGIGYLVNHKDSIDGYFGAGAGDRLEQQGLFENVELAELNHIRVTRETTLSTGCLTAVIVTVEATDEIGRQYIAGNKDYAPSITAGTADTGGGIEAAPAAVDDVDENDISRVDWENPDIAFTAAKVNEAFGDSLEGWSIRPKYGDGFMTFMFIFEYTEPETAIEVPLELYLINPDSNGDGIFDGTDTGEGVYLCTVNFSTEPNNPGKRFIGETSGRTVCLYDYALLSDQFVSVINRADMTVDVVFEFSDGTCCELTDDDVELMHYFDRGGVPSDSDGGSNDASAADTRLVFSRFIDSRKVDSVIINGERFTAA